MNTIRYCSSFQLDFARENFIFSHQNPVLLFTQDSIPSLTLNHHKTTILTAANCLYGLPRTDISVLVGTNTLSQGGQTIIASSLAYHQSYDPTTLVNDIGIVKLSKPIQFNKNIQPISLGHTNPRNGEAVIVSGWGLTSVRGQAPNLLRKLSAEVLDLQRCSERLEAANPISTSNICTVVPQGQGVCFGDNGAALIGLSGELNGIVSWGMPCALGFPNVYTNVAFYADWIKSFLD